MTHTLTSRLPDYRLDPPAETPEPPWATLTEGERINRILDEFAPREVAQFYVEQLEHLDRLITLARAGSREAIDRYVRKNRLDERAA
jgi:hypothetical protein